VLRAAAEHRAIPAHHPDATTAADAYRRARGAAQAGALRTGGARWHSAGRGATRSGTGQLVGFSRRACQRYVGGPKRRLRTHAVPPHRECRHPRAPFT